MCADFSDSGFHHYTSISPSCLFQSQRAGRSQIDSLKPWRLGKPTGWLLWYCRMLVIWIRHVQYWPWLESSSINRKYPTYIMWNYILVSIHICQEAFIAAMIFCLQLGGLPPWYHDIIAMCWCCFFWTYVFLVLSLAQISLFSRSPYNVWASFRHSSFNFCFLEHADTCIFRCD